MIAKLSKRDVERLLTDPSPENRAATAALIADDFQEGGLGPRERELALEIFGIMAEDAALRVRRALADHLKDCPEISRALARRLAVDADIVAVPVLRCSLVLTDDDLVEIVRASGEAKHRAIAARQTLSDTVAGSLVEHGSAAVVARVMENPGAELSEDTLNRAIDRHGGSEAVSGAVARRGVVPMAVAERLVALAAETLQRQLAGEEDFSADGTADVVASIRERATLSLVDPRFGIGDAAQLVGVLAGQGRLTPGIVVRGLCLGDVAFFEAAMAHLARLPILNAQLLTHDEGRRGLRALWDRAGMPEALFPVALAAVEVCEELDYDGGPDDRLRYRRRVIERLLTRLDDAGTDLAGFDSDSLDYLMAKLGEMCAA